ncbi:helix-turn-helix domain-containing protein [Nocardia gipuzkoensis]
MSGSSPPTRRVVQVIELLADRHPAPTRLSDVVHALGLNKATAYAILAELCDAGWVTRDPVNKAFFVSGGLGRIAEQIDGSRSMVHAAHAAAVAAAREFGCAASVSERVGDSLVISAFIAGGDGGWSMAVGDRLPFAAPFGPAYAAWEPDAGRRAWVERSGVDSTAFAASLDEQLEQIRADGYSVERLSPDMVAAIPAMTRLHADTLSPSIRRHVDEVLVELSGAVPVSGPGSHPEHYVGAITAPIFDDQGRVAFNLCVHPFTTLPRPRVGHIGRQLGAMATAVGEPPPAGPDRLGEEVRPS